MADECVIDYVKVWEDKITEIFGTTSLEFDLRTLKYLRLKHPNQSSQVTELERAIEIERRKARK